MTIRMGLFVLGLFTACGTPEPEKTLQPEPKEEVEPVNEPAPVPQKPTLKEGAKVFFVSPQDGASVTSPVSIQFGLEGAEVKPAGENVPNSGHHHLIINGTGIEHGIVVPKDETHIHYGKGMKYEKFKKQESFNNRWSKRYR